MVILGYAQLLKERIGGKELEHVLDAAAQLRYLMHSMFNLQYVDTGEVQLEKSLFCLNQLVGDVIKERDSSVETKDQVLTLNLEDGQCEVIADQDSLRLVLTNLISNAVKFTPAGGMIGVTVARRSEEVWVAVRDNGIGIKDAVQRRIFDRFYQVEPLLTRQHGGLGIGLAVAKDLLELQNGRIWVSSQEGKGSNFTFALPLATE